jgi:hypothetical protein
VATNDLMIQGMEPGAVYDRLIAKGLNKIDAAKIVGEWLLQTFGGAERHFAYTEEVAATDAGCVNTFQQQFHHEDWLDGFSVVQAGKTAGEDGFNDRLHRIEDDLAALSKQITKALECSTTLRKQVAAALQDVKIELNRLDHDVWQLQQLADRTGVGGGIIKTGKFLGVSEFLGDKVTVWQTPEGYYTLPAVNVLDKAGGGLGVGPNVGAAGDLSKFIHTTPEVRDAFGGQVRVKDFTDRFGSTPVEGGGTVADLVKILPQDATYDSLDAMVKDAADRTAAVINATNTTGAAIAGTFTELGAGIADPGAASIARLGGIPVDARTALVSAGIDTVAKLADANVDEISTHLRDAGVGANVGDAASWKGIAMTLNGLHQ